MSKKISPTFCKSRLSDRTLVRVARHLGRRGLRLIVEGRQVVLVQRTDATLTDETWTFTDAPTEPGEAGRL